MPRPRFEKLPPARREALLEAAAKEFAAHGYEGASLNRILDVAGVSKGAAYYYFDDKADLFLTTVARYAEELAPAEDLRPADLATFTSQTFWPWVAEVYRRPFARVATRSWVFGVVKAARKLPPDVAADGPLGAHSRRITEFLTALIAQGRRIGAIRTDLPAELEMALFMAVDDAGDQWLLQHWDELAPEEMEQMLDRIVDTLRRALMPDTHGRSDR